MRHQQSVFRHLFDRDAFKAFRSTYENINPDRPNETQGIRFEDTDPLFRAMVGHDPDTKSFVDEFLPHLGKFLHGPFPLPGGRVTPSAWDCRGKAGAYAACGLTANTVRGKRVLDVGCNAGYDVFYFSKLGALEAVGLEPHGFYTQALFLAAVYNQPGVHFFNTGWENLDSHYVGNYDLISCLGLIYHVKEPSQLLDRLGAVMRPGARLVMESHVLSESSKQALYVEDGFWGDETYWWIFGDQCLTAMLHTAGFKDVRICLKADCDSRNPADPKTTVEGYPAGARAWITATKK